MSEVYYVINRLHTYPMKKKERKKERNEHNKIHFTTEPVPNKHHLKIKIKER
jgi:hypothetical protein